MIIQVTNETSRELAALVAVVSLAMIAISVHLLPRSFNRFQHYFGALSPSARKSALPILALTHLPILWVVIFAVLSIECTNRMPGIFWLVFAGTLVLVLLIKGGLAIKRRTKKQIAVRVEPFPIAYTVALSYLALSVFLNIFALIGVSSSMLMIDIGPGGYENFEWGKWFLFIAIFTFCVGIIEFGLTLALDRARQRNDSSQEKH